MLFTNIPINQILEIHKKTIDISGGGVYQVLDIGRLESVIANIDNDEYYPTFVDKLTHLFFCANKFHCFLDGNKRIAIVLCAQLLLLNGYMYCVKEFIHIMENISYHLAAGKIEKPLLHDIINAVLEQTYDDNEGLKLRIVNAISE